MKLQCFASIALDGDEPAAGIARFVAALRQSAVDTDAASLELTLFGTSVRALTALREFRPERARTAPFAQDFRWQGSPPASGAPEVFARRAAGQLRPEDTRQGRAHQFRQDRTRLAQARVPGLHRDGGFIFGGPVREAPYRRAASGAAPGC